MKKRHHKRHSLARLGYEVFDPFDIETRAAVYDKSDAGLKIEADFSEQHRSKSLPNLPDWTRSFGLGLLSSRQANIEELQRSHSRRWTMPTKAAPTRGITMASSVPRKENALRKPKRRPSPAIITLRRATSNLRRDSGITFFPPPTFNRTRTNFLSTLLSTVSGDAWSTKETNKDEETSVQFSTSEASSWHPLLGPDMQSRDNAPVSPAFTQVDIEPSLLLTPGTAMPRPRRCSTQYVSGSSTYEVIWDENDTPSSSDGSSIRSSRTEEELNLCVRRRSAAVKQLETQMARAVAQSRRESSTATHRSSHENTSGPRQGQSFQQVINSALSRFFNEAALRHLPRSRASRDTKLPPTQVPFGVPARLMLDDAHATTAQYGTELFPPLVSNVQNNMPELNPQSLSESSRQPQSFEALDRSRMGSLVGASARQRRKTTTRILSIPDRSPSGSLTGPGPPRKSTIFKSRDEEAMPLLSTPNWARTIQGRV